MKIWEVSYRIKGESVFCVSQRVVAKDYLEAVEKANKLIDGECKTLIKGLYIAKIEEEADELDAV